MSKILDAVIDARDDDDEAQMRMFFYGAGGFDSEEEEINKITEVKELVRENDADTVDTGAIVPSINTLKVIPDVDIQIQVQECKQRGIAHQVWPAATFLSEYLVKSPHLLVQDASEADDGARSSEINDDEEEIVFLELGAGVGVTGIYLDKYFRVANHRIGNRSVRVQHTVLSDLAEALNGLQDNIRINSTDSSSAYSTETISASILSWGNENELLETLELLCQKLNPLSTEVTEGVNKRRTLVILAADVIYWECLFDPLLDCLMQILQHTSSNGRFSSYFSQTRVLIAHYKRWKKDQIFLNRCQKRLQKNKLGSFQCLHEDILSHSSDDDAHTADGSESAASTSQPREGTLTNFGTKKEIRRIYLIKSL